MNFVTRIAAAAGKFPDRVSIEGVGNAGTQTMTYAGLIGEAERWAIKLSELGVQRGDRVAIIADNDAAWVTGPNRSPPCSRTATPPWSSSRRATPGPRRRQRRLETPEGQRLLSRCRIRLPGLRPPRARRSPG